MKLVLPSIVDGVRGFHGSDQSPSRKLAAYLGKKKLIPCPLERRSVIGFVLFQFERKATSQLCI